MTKTQRPGRWEAQTGASFEIDLDEGELRFKKKPDYEKPTDADMDNVYEVTVQASDGKLTGMLKVKVTVSNENEVGTVSLGQGYAGGGHPGDGHSEGRGRRHLQAHMGVDYLWRHRWQWARCNSNA